MPSNGITVPIIIKLKNNVYSFSYFTLGGNLQVAYPEVVDLVRIGISFRCWASVNSSYYGDSRGKYENGFYGLVF